MHTVSLKHALAAGLLAALLGIAGPLAMPVARALAETGGSTTGGSTTGGKKVYFDHVSLAAAAEIGTDERNHVAPLRSALGSQAIAGPNINLDALGYGLDSEDNFLRVARIFEDIGVSAYAGAAGLLTTSSIITTAARILAVEAEHVGCIRTQIYYHNITTSAIDGADQTSPRPVVNRSRFFQSITPAVESIRR